MFERASNKALIEKVSKFNLHLEVESGWISAVVLSREYAVTTLHSFPEVSCQIGAAVIIYDQNCHEANAVVHGINRKSDFVVLKLSDLKFQDVPDYVCPETLDRYIAMGFVFGEKKPSFRLGNVSSLASDGTGFYYGDSGGLPGYSGGGVYYANTGSLMGIGRGSYWENKETNGYGGVLQMISIQVVLTIIAAFNDQPFDM